MLQLKSHEEYANHVLNLTTNYAIMTLYKHIYTYIHICVCFFRVEGGGGN